MAAVAKVVEMGLISNHLEYESTVTRNVCPWNGLAKPTCTRDHGILLDSHLVGEALGGDGRDSWQCWHRFTQSFISLSLPGHQM